MDGCSNTEHLSCHDPFKMIILGTYGLKRGVTTYLLVTFVIPLDVVFLRLAESHLHLHHRLRDVNV